ncbi:hypothetical protein P7K49_011906, partial [Saguinus oedipus]
MAGLQLSHDFQVGSVSLEMRGDVFTYFFFAFNVTSALLHEPESHPNAVMSLALEGQAGRVTLLTAGPPALPTLLFPLLGLWWLLEVCVQ